jgi:hypothetical protein
VILKEELGEDVDNQDYVDAIETEEDFISTVMWKIFNKKTVLNHMYAFYQSLILASLMSCVSDLEPVYCFCFCLPSAMFCYDLAGSSVWAYSKIEMYFILFMLFCSMNIQMAWFYFYHGKAIYDVGIATAAANLYGAIGFSQLLGKSFKFILAVNILTYSYR